MTARVAKDKKLRLWKNYQPPTSALPIAEKAYVAKVFISVLLTRTTYWF